MARNPAAIDMFIIGKRNIEKSLSLLPIGLERNMNWDNCDYF